MATREQKDRSLNDIERRGWQPKPMHQPTGDPQGGYQPTTSEQKPPPDPPPKKP